MGRLSGPTEVFLRYLFRDEPRPRIVPVLCGSLQDLMEKGVTPGENSEYRAFIDELRGALAQLGRTVLVVAGVDLAHVGLKFGATQPVDDDELRRIEAADRECLGFLETLSGTVSTTS